MERYTIDVDRTTNPNHLGSILGGFSGQILSYSGEEREGDRISTIEVEGNEL